MAKKTKAVKKVNSSDVKEFNLIDEKIIDEKLPENTGFTNDYLA